MMRLTRPQWCWLAYDPGNAAFALVVRAVFAPLFFMECARGAWSDADATGYWGLVSSAAGVAAGFFSLYLGAVADARGRRKVALGMFVLLGVLAGIGLCWTGPGDDRAILLLYFTALAAYMIGNSFYDALLLSVAKPSEFHFLSSFAYGCGYVGGMIPFLVCLAWGWYSRDSLGTAYAAFVIASIWWGVFTLPLLLGVRETPGKRLDTRWFDGFRELAATVRELGKYRNALLFLVAYFLYIDGVSTILLMATPISVDIGMPQWLLLATILGLQVIGFPSTVGFGSLARRVGARRMVYAALLLYVLTALLIGLLSISETYEVRIGLFLAAALLIALAQGGIQSLSRSLFGMLIPQEKAAEFFGVYNIFGKFTTILGPVLVYLAGRWWGHTEYGIVLLIVPFAAGGLLLSRVRFPDNAKI